MRNTTSSDVAGRGFRRALLRLAPATFVAVGALACAHHLATRHGGAEVVADAPVHAAPARAGAASLTVAPHATVRKAVGYDPRVTSTDSMQALSAALPQVPAGNATFDPNDPAAGGELKRTAVTAVHNKHLSGLHVDPMPTGVSLAAPTDTASLYARSGAVPQTPAELQAATAASAVPSGTPNTVGLAQHVAPSCSGTGTDGNRVQAMYVHEAGTTDRYKSVLSVLRNEVANVDDVFAVSSRKTGGDLRVRWVHDASCTPTILDVTVPAGSTSNFNTQMNAMSALGYGANNRKYLMFTDANDLCGIGTLYSSTTASPTSNWNNGLATSYARIDVNCWSTANSVAAHELTHNLGGVQQGAPHATANSHCYDESDLMCYADGSGVAMRQICASSQEDLLDCNNDDYFNTRPASGSYLATHWNVARSSFLEAPVATPDPVAPVVTVTSAGATPQTGDAVRLTATSTVPGSTWSWTSSVPDCRFAGAGTATPTLTCPASVAGLVTATVTATASGLSGTGSTALVVTTAAAPTATLAAPSEGYAGRAFAVSASPTGKAPYAYAWSVTGPCTFSSTTAAAPALTCTATGDVAVSVTVTQNDGQSVTADPVTVHVVDASRAPALPSSWTSVVRSGQKSTVLSAALRDAASGAGLAGAPVQLQVLPRGSSTWTTGTGTLTTDASGRVSITPSVTGAAYYRLAFLGDAQHTASVSHATYLKPATRLRLSRVGRHQVVGQLTTSAGAPVRAARLVLERRVAGSSHWQVVTSQLTGAHGFVTVRVAPRRATYYRWTFHGEVLHRNALSSRVLFRG